MVGRAKIATRVVAACTALSSCGGQSAVEKMPPSCPMVVTDAVIQVPQTTTSMLMSTRVSAHASDTATGIDIAIDENKGTVAFGGREPVASYIYKRIPWPDLGLTLFAGLGASDGTWSLFWVYCDGSGKLVRFYAERTDSPATLNVVVDGSCSEIQGYWNMPVDVPAHTLTNIPLTCGFSVSEPSPQAVPLDLGSSRPGTATIDGLPATALVFSTTDCRSGCGQSSWFELHSILWRPESAQVGFAIWYLAADALGQGVSGLNGIVLPDSGWTDIPHRTATWTLDR